MLKDTNIIDEYILDYLAGEANKAEIQELEAWLAETGDEGKAHFKAMARHFYAVRWSGMREEDEKHILQLCGLSVKRVKTRSSPTYRPYPPYAADRRRKAHRTAGKHANPPFI